MATKLDHIGVAVKSIDRALPLYRDVLGLNLERVEQVAGQGVTVAILGLGDTRIELLEPAGPDTPVGRFLAKRGEGIHHIAIGVPDLAAAAGAALGAGLRLIDEAPSAGTGGRLVAFIHPRSTGGVLIELSEEGDPDNDR